MPALIENKPQMASEIGLVKRYRVTSMREIMQIKNFNRMLLNF